MSSTNKEIELKLRVDPQDLARLVKSPLLGLTDTTIDRLHSTYFDTCDLQLKRRHATLRIRRNGAHFVQTVKSADDASHGLHRRGEWEADVAGETPDLSAIADGDGHDRLQGIHENQLTPVFETDIKRTVHRVVGNASIDVAIDEGEIRTGGGAVLPVCEIELELKEGDPQALFDLALELNGLAPLHIETRSKAARGYSLVSGERRHPVKAGKVAIEPDDTVEQAFIRIISDCLAHLSANEASALHGDDPEGIHQMRVALRRLRSALVLFRRFLPPEHYDSLNGEVKWLAGCLGPARDWDAFRLSLLEPLRAAMPDDHELQALAVAVEGARQRAYQVARNAILSNRYTRLLLTFNGWLETDSWRNQALSEGTAHLLDPIGPIADALLHKRCRTLRKRGRHFTHLPPEKRHDVRKALKKFRYSIEFLRALYGRKAVKRYQKRLLPLQDGLGELNDMATARHLMTSLLKKGKVGADPSWRLGAGLTVGWHAHAATGVESRVGKDWKQFTAAKPFWS